MEDYYAKRKKDGWVIVGEEDDLAQDKYPELEKLIKRWLKRREKLRKQASDLRKIDTKANLSHSDQFLGKFNEIDKCRSELVTIYNRMKKGL